MSILPSSEIKDHLLWPIWWWPFDVYLFHWFFIKLDIGLRLSNQTKYEDKNKEIRGKSITKYIHLTRKQHAFLGNDTLSNFQIQLGAESSKVLLESNEMIWCRIFSLWCFSLWCFDWIWPRYLIIQDNLLSCSAFDNDMACGGGVCFETGLSLASDLSFGFWQGREGWHANYLSSVGKHRLKWGQMTSNYQKTQNCTGSPLRKL